MARLPVLAFLVASLSPLVAQAADPTLEIDGVRNGRGYSMVARFESADAFKADRRLAEAFLAAGADRAVAAFPELEPGPHVVSAFHDEDGDGGLDTYFLGVPREGFGFGDDTSDLADPPGFDAASFAMADHGRTSAFELNC